jgi:hypothetical protein
MHVPYVLCVECMYMPYLVMGMCMHIHDPYVDAVWVVMAYISAHCNGIGSEILLTYAHGICVACMYMLYALWMVCMHMVHA